eukprot:60938_1
MVFVLQHHSVKLNELYCNPCIGYSKQKNNNYKFNRTVLVLKRECKDESHFEAEYRKQLEYHMNTSKDHKQAMNASRETESPNDICLVLKAEVAYQMLLSTQPYKQFEETLYTLHRIKRRAEVKTHCKCNCFNVGDKNQSVAECKKLFSVFFDYVENQLNHVLNTGNAYPNNVSICWLSISLDGMSDGSFKGDLVVVKGHSNDHEVRVRGTDLMEHVYDDSENKIKTIKHTVSSLAKMLKRYNATPTDLSMMDELSDVKIHILCSFITDHVYLHKKAVNGSDGSQFEVLVHEKFYTTMFFVGCVQDPYHDIETDRRAVNVVYAERAFVFGLISQGLKVLRDPKWTYMTHHYQVQLTFKLRKWLPMCPTRWWKWSVRCCRRIILNYEPFMYTSKAMELAGKGAEWRPAWQSSDFVIHLCLSVDNGENVFEPLCNAHQEIRTTFPFFQSYTNELILESAAQMLEGYETLKNIIEAYQHRQFDVNYNIMVDVSKLKHIFREFVSHIPSILSYKYKGHQLNSMNMAHAYLNQDDKYKNVDPKQMLSKALFEEIFGEDPETEDDEEDEDIEFEGLDDEGQALAQRVSMPRAVNSRPSYNPFDSNTYGSKCSVHCRERSHMIKCSNPSCEMVECVEHHSGIPSDIRALLSSYSVELFRKYKEGQEHMLCKRCAMTIHDTVELYEQYLFDWVTKWRERIKGFKESDDYHWVGLSVHKIIDDCQALDFDRCKILLQLYERKDWIDGGRKLFLKLYDKYVALCVNENALFGALLPLRNHTAQTKVFIMVKKWIVKHIVQHIHDLKDDDYPLSFESNKKKYLYQLYCDLKQYINSDNRVVGIRILYNFHCSILPTESIVESCGRILSIIYTDTKKCLLHDRIRELLLARLLLSTDDLKRNEVVNEILEMYKVKYPTANHYNKSKYYKSKYHKSEVMDNRANKKDNSIFSM